MTRPNYNPDPSTYKNPNSAQNTAFKIGSYTYVVYDFVDNRQNFMIAAFDESGNLIKSWEKGNGYGTRYVKDISINREEKKIDFKLLQYMEPTVSVDWSEFYIPTIVARPNYNPDPSVYKNPYYAQNSASAFEIGPYTYVVYDFVDNRQNFMIAAFDEAGNFIKSWEKGNGNSTRYLTDISINEAEQQINFKLSQYNEPTVAIDWSEFFIQDKISAIALTSVGVNVASNQITGTTTAMQYSINSTNGTDGTWVNATATNTSVAFIAGDVYVRQTALPTNFRKVTTIATAATALAATKVQGTTGGTIKLTGLTNGVTYVYVVDNNATLAADAAEWSGATSVTLSGTEIDNIAVDSGQYVHLRVKATTTDLASDVQNVQIALGDINPAAALGVTVADALGSSNDGKGTITTPSLPASATGFKYQVNATAPTVLGGQSTVTGWASLTESATSAPIALTNGQVVTVATVDASGNVIAIQNITVSGIADYIAGTDAVKVGTKAVGVEQTVFNGFYDKFYLNGVKINLVNLKASNNGAASVAQALQADIAAVFTGIATDDNGNSTQTFTVTAGTDGDVGKLIITALSTGDKPEVGLGGSDGYLLQFLGLTANTITGTRSSN